MLDVERGGHDDEGFLINVVDVVAMVFFFFDLRVCKALEFVGDDALKEEKFEFDSWKRSEFILTVELKWWKCRILVLRQ